MSAKNTWQMFLYKANADPSAATPYARVAVATLAGYGGYATQSYYITRSGLITEATANTLTDVSGATFGSLTSVIIFNVKLWPLQFNASTEPDLDDAAALRTFLHKAPWLWARFAAGSRQQPSATEAYPVVVTEYSESVSEEGGVHNIELVLKHKYDMTNY